MSFKSVLSPENSVLAGVATAAFAVAVYESSLGSVAGVHMTDANHPVTQASLRKAGFTAAAAVAGVAILARDPNIVIIGGAAIIAMELHYRHAIQTDPGTGQPVPAGNAAYAPVETTDTAQPYGGQPYMAESPQIG